MCFKRGFLAWFGSALLTLSSTMACSGGDEAGTTANADLADGEGAGASSKVAETSDGLPGTPGPDDSAPQRFAPPLGRAADGQAVFRFETFGNEGFWTRTLRLPQGMLATGLTPVAALAAGVSIDIEKVPAAQRAQVIAEAKTDLSTASAPLLNDPAALVALLEANAVVGFAARNVQTLNGKLDIDDANVYAGESVGVTCALCHSITDGSVYSSAKGGSIGKRVDGPTNHNLNLGASLARAENSRAIYPMLALDLITNAHQSLSRKGPGLGLISKLASEAEVDAYLTDPELYPIGMFDDVPDGNGAPVHIAPLFRADLAAPWGSEGSLEMLQNFSNLVYTALFDPTTLTTAGGRQFLLERSGAVGLEIVENYTAILADLGVPAGGSNGYPFVARAGNPEVTIGLPAGVYVEESLLGVQVNPSKLKDLNAYLSALPSPVGIKSDAEAIARGRLVFRAECTSCHNDDQSRFVPQDIVPFNDMVELFADAPARPWLWPDYDGAVLAVRSAAGLARVRNSSGTFDDKLVITEASNRKQPRGDALPLLMDLARKPSFLHDDSVPTLSALFDPKRGPGKPHPFYVGDGRQRADLIAFLQSLDDQPLP